MVTISEFVTFDSWFTYRNYGDLSRYGVKRPFRMKILSVFVWEQLKAVNIADKR
jgi:hypothetical protein